MTPETALTNDMGGCPTRIQWSMSCQVSSRNNTPTGHSMEILIGLWQDPDFMAYETDRIWLGRISWWTGPCSSAQVRKHKQNQTGPLNLRTQTMRLGKMMLLPFLKSFSLFQTAVAFGYIYRSCRFLPTLPRCKPRAACPAKRLCTRQWLPHPCLT